MAGGQQYRPTEAEGERGGIRILHVDDEPGLVRVTSRKLERRDDAFEVVTETSAAEALERLDSSSVDCIVSDYQMPGMDGIEFLRRVRERYPDLPFILFTGRGSEEVASDAIREGATDYLQKQSGDEYQLLENRIRNAVTQYRGKRAERHLRELAENTDRILYIFDRDWSELLFVSPAYEDIWGRSLETLREDPTDFLDGIHPDDRDMVRDNMAKMSAGESITIEYRVNADEDYGRWVRVRGEPIEDDDGEVVRVAGFATEITAEKHRREDLKYQRSVLDSVVDTVPHGILVVDDDREFFTYNGRFVEMWDIPEEVVETGDDREALTSVLDRLRDPEAFVEQVEYFYDHPEEESKDLVHLADGRCFERYTAPVTAAGEYFGRVWIFRDVTDRLEYERDLERQNERLDAFASVVSHDLRNPLTVARGNVELARENPREEYFEDAEQALERMRRLVEDLLTLARDGRTVEDPDAVALSSVVDEAWDSVVTDEAGLETDRCDRHLLADPHRLQELLENLFHNAIEHGGDAVTVRVEGLEDGFAVADDGPGVSAADRERVFEHGFTTRQDGTGFGLAIVRSIVEAHGWSIDLGESQEGGARIDVTGVTVLEED